MKNKVMIFVCNLIYNLLYTLYSYLNKNLLYIFQHIFLREDMKYVISNIITCIISL